MGQKNRTIPKIGQMVTVRSRAAIVKDIIPSTNNTNMEVFHAVELQYIDGWMNLYRY